MFYCFHIVNHSIKPTIDRFSFLWDIIYLHCLDSNSWYICWLLFSTIWWMLTNQLSFLYGMSQRTYHTYFNIKELPCTKLTSFFMNVHFIYSPFVLHNDNDKRKQHTNRLTVPITSPCSWTKTKQSWKNYLWNYFILKNNLGKDMFLYQLNTEDNSQKSN